MINAWAGRVGHWNNAAEVKMMIETMSGENPAEFEAIQRLKYYRFIMVYALYCVLYLPIVLYIRFEVLYRTIAG